MQRLTHLKRPAWLRLAESHILVEQLRLIYTGMTLSVVPMFPAILLLVWVLMNEVNRTAMLLWGVAVVTFNVYVIFNARQRLAQGVPIGQAVELARQLFVSMGVSGICWGVLAYAVLGKTTAVGTILVISVLAGLVGGAMSLLSAVLPIFVAFSAPMVGITIARLWQLDDPAYNAFGIISLLYLGVLIVHASNSSKATLSAIELRFENLELVRAAEAARHDAEQANLAKSKFLAAASHDLRQPIHAQGLFLDVLSRTPLSTQQRELVSNISATSAASADMLNTLLDFSRIEAGVVKPQVQAFLLQTVLNKIEREFEPQADAKGLTYRSRETRLRVQSDPALIELVLRNLVSNAIRYTDHGGLLVGCRLRAGHAVVEVWDTGIGIAPENHVDIFKEFHQLGNPERDRRKGLGLGLAIADGLVKTLGHGLTLVSVPGRGSTFRLTLPLALERAAHAQVPLQVSAGRMQGLRVLVIDDDEAVLTAMAGLLRSWGCRVNTAGSIRQALQLARVQLPDIVISDYRLRGQRTGAQAICEVRALLGNNIPALMITGDTAPERLREALGTGVPLLHKPVAPEQLYRALAALLAPA